MPGRVPSEPGWDGEHQLSGSHFELCLDPKTCLHCGLDMFQIQLCLSSYYFWARMPKLCGSLAMLPTNFSNPNSPDADAHELESLGLSRVATRSSRLSPSSARTDAEHQNSQIARSFHGSLSSCRAAWTSKPPSKNFEFLRWMQGIGPEVAGLGNQAGPAINGDIHKNDKLQFQENTFLQQHHMSATCFKNPEISVELKASGHGQV